MADKHRIRVPGARRLPPLGTEFVHVEVLSGIVLAFATVVALVLANVATVDYEEFWHTSLKVGVGDLAIDETLQHWVNDGLMTLFFFVVGLEIKRELVVGDLRDRQTAALPVAAAVGGMVVPALIFVALNLGGEGIDGWAIPMATDIAFALAVLAIVGSKAPKELKLFLLTLAIVDDIGAIVVIALFYGDGIEPLWLLGAVATVGVIVAMRRASVVRPLWYLLPGVVLWICTFESGVHATIAGVVLGLLTPTGPVAGREVLVDLEARLHPWSSFLVVPVFALANAGVVLDRASLEAAVTGTVAWGVVLGLVVGKPLGIMTASALAVRLRIGVLPAGVALRHLTGLSLIAGIGFTVSLFVADLAFVGELLGEAKVAILAASVLAAAGGSILVRATVPKSWD
ncbi:MAG: Na+/H+ antiporter NhaA [Acidimicrobiales bacterium]